MNKKRNIDFSLIWKKIHQNESDDSELNEWLNGSEKNIAFFKNAKRFYYGGSTFKTNPVSSDAAFKKLRTVIMRHRIIQIGASAAAILAVVFSVSILLNKTHTEDFVSSAEITPGSNKAVLVLNNGSEVNLSERQKVLLKEEDTQITSNGKMLEYHSAKKKKIHKKQIIYNTLKVPRGGQFFVVLSDSTCVWLNAESELHYPVTFSGKKREVTLVGEAYFEVAKNEHQPFIVDSENQKIEVLGTSFNVSAYANNEFIKTTLVEGSVKINSSTQEVFLEPSLQAVVDPKNGNTVTLPVKTELYTGWKEGNYYFENEAIETILKTISRWYDFEYEFKKPAAKKMRFTGSINREQELENIFKIIEETQQIKMTAYERKLVIH
ncbi:FecR family protein [uncultured Draconibacterium sp.]|uniref:FecR family protein n=1 Tax=uncultured Draconibacterium sp. TaxID=1573823 RepID=UPI0025E7D5CF|nr:FecR domain-containing protein [uncultured Draconibacterium sp.]